MATLLTLLAFGALVGLAVWRAGEQYRAKNWLGLTKTAVVGATTLVVVVAILLVALLQGGAREPISALVRFLAWLVWSGFIFLSLGLWGAVRGSLRVWLAAVLSSLVAGCLAGPAAAGPLMRIFAGVLLLPPAIYLAVQFLGQSGGPLKGIGGLAAVVALVMSWMLVQDVRAAYRAMTGPASQPAAVSRPVWHPLPSPPPRRAMPAPSPSARSAPAPHPVVRPRLGAPRPHPAAHKNPGVASPPIMTPGPEDKVLPGSGPVP